MYVLSVQQRTYLGKLHVFCIFLKERDIHIMENCTEEKHPNQLLQALISRHVSEKALERMALKQTLQGY